MVARAGSKTAFTEAESDLLIYAGVRVEAREIERITIKIGAELERRNREDNRLLVAASGRNLDLNAAPTIPIPDLLT